MDLECVYKECKYYRHFWGFGFVLVNAFYVFNSGELNTRKILLLVLVSIWGLRLAFYLAWRNIGKGEDFRYQEFRKTMVRNVTGGLVFPNLSAAGNLNYDSVFTTFGCSIQYDKGRS